jgi:hypothetical protein
MSSDPILEAALRVLGSCSAGSPCVACDRWAAEVIAAVRPLIVAEVREQIAREYDLLAALHRGYVKMTDVVVMQERHLSAATAFHEAARIARGGNDE